MKKICQEWAITNEEYQILEKMFGRLAHKQAWNLEWCNYNNNVCEDHDDMVQEIRIAMIRAGSYYKRQTYIESCFRTLDEHAKNPYARLLVARLRYLWKNRTRHGANRQKFGEYQERMLDALVARHVPKPHRPSRDEQLVVNPEFENYCKQITRNEQRRMGKKITREKSWRRGLVSLNQYDCVGYLAENS